MTRSVTRRLPRARTGVPGQLAGRRHLTVDLGQATRPSCRCRTALRTSSRAWSLRARRLRRCGEIEGGVRRARETLGRGRVGEDARLRRRSTYVAGPPPCGRHDDEPDSHRLEDRDAELLLEARADIDAGRCSVARPSAHAAPATRWSSRSGGARPASRPCVGSLGGGHDGVDAGQLGGLLVGRVVEVAPHDSRLQRSCSRASPRQACTRVAIPLTGLSRPTDTTVGRARRSLGDGVEEGVELVDGGAHTRPAGRPRTRPGRRLDDAVDSGHVDALADDADALTLGLEVDARGSGAGPRRPLVEGRARDARPERRGRGAGGRGTTGAPRDRPRRSPARVSVPARSRASMRA